MPRSVVIGANRGIGFALCSLLRARGDEVIAVCREPAPALTELGCRVEHGIDVTHAGVTDELRRRFASVGVDLLIHNAGVLVRMGLDSLDFEAIRRQLEVNAIGPLRVVAGVLPSMPAGSKIGLVTSRMGSIGDNDSGGHYGYRMSKAALNAAGRSLALDLRARGIAVAVLHPGWVRTQLTGGTGNLDPDEAARGMLARLDELDLARTGTFWHQSGEVLPW
jgi:NAD(P)-dependent dehydrogenase (short-subunit alcohol dehydrogenase family)